MYPSQKIAARYKRWRHGRGFGVHSPFAFRFITEVLRQRLGYYAYTDIDGVCRREAMTRSQSRLMRMLFRVALDCGVRRVAVCGPDPGGAIAVAVTSASKSIVMADSPADADMAVVTDAGARGVESLLERAASQRPFVAVVVGATARSPERELFERIKSSMAHGMTFDNGRSTAIAVVRPTLPRQDFSAKF